MKKTLCGLFCVSFLIVLTACTNVADTSTTLNQSSDITQTNQDIETCLQISRTTAATLQNETLAEIYSERPNKNVSWDAFFGSMHALLKQCETDLAQSSTPTNRFNYFIANALGETPQFSEDANAITPIRALRIRIEDYYQEKATKAFAKKTGGRHICATSTNDSQGLLVSFFESSMTVPDRSCVYMHSPNNIPLTVAQTTPQGVLVAIDLAPGRSIFLYNDNPKEDALVDGAAIAPGYFIYAGKFSYLSITGPRSVYSFRRITNSNEN